MLFRPYMSCFIKPCYPGTAYITLSYLIMFLFNNIINLVFAEFSLFSCILIYYIVRDLFLEYIKKFSLNIIKIYYLF